MKRTLVLNCRGSTSDQKDRVTKESNTVQVQRQKD
jgi:hypothetical protein